MPTKEQMLLEISKIDDYEIMRDYCGPCKGAGHFHQLNQRGERLMPEILPCITCNRIGFTPKNSVYTLTVAFNLSHKPDKVYVIASTKNGNTNYKSYINSPLTDENTVDGNDEFETLIRKIYNFEKTRL